MDFKVTYYQDSLGKFPVEEFLLGLGKTNKVLQARTFKGIEKLRIKAYHKEPLSKYVEPGLWELRIRAGSNILRILYTFTKGQIIILLHGFVKKQQKTPIGELEEARKRLKDLKIRKII